MATKVAAKSNYHVVYNVTPVSFLLFRFYKLKSHGFVICKIYLKLIELPKSEMCLTTDL